MSSATNLRLALCLFPNVTALDFQGPSELLGFLMPSKAERLTKALKVAPKYTIDMTYLSHTMDPVNQSSGPPLVPSRTYDEANEQYDILLIPGGAGARPGVVPDVLLEFIKRQEAGAQFILTVCTGSWILAGTGLLRGKRATSNKSVFKDVVEATKGDGIEWIAKARYIVNDDKKIWTSSGVTAGMDMASAFLDYLVGKETGDFIRGVVELRAKDDGDDEFAEYYGLL
ncbi:hypothetical protein ONZ45_g7088 [Pleurotus djamor]|nr:hypothetical protein ONZ45_g7088 [Pleurotus djamor]